MDLSAVTAKQAGLTLVRIILLLMGTFWKVLPRAGVAWIWSNPDSDCASPGVWAHSIPAPTAQAAVTVQPCLSPGCRGL